MSCPCAVCQLTHAPSRQHMSTLWPSRSPPFLPPSLSLSLAPPSAVPVRSAAGEPERRPPPSLGWQAPAFHGGGVSSPGGSGDESTDRHAEPCRSHPNRRRRRHHTQTDGESGRKTARGRKKQTQLIAQRRFESLF